MFNSLLHGGLMRTRRYNKPARLVGKRLDSVENLAIIYNDSILFGSAARNEE